MANCNNNSCVIWYDGWGPDWTVMNDCTGPCRCPIDKIDPPPAGGPCPVMMMNCEGTPLTATSNLSSLATGTIRWADSWTMQRHCPEYICIGCEWSRGDGIVQYTGFKSASNRPRYSTLKGDSAEIVILGGMRNGQSNLENGLPDPWIIGHASLVFPGRRAAKDKRINLAGHGTFSVEDQS